MADEISGVNLKEKRMRPKNSGDAEESIPVHLGLLPIAVAPFPSKKQYTVAGETDSTLNTFVGALYRPPEPFLNISH